MPLGDCPSLSDVQEWRRESERIEALRARTKRIITEISEMPEDVSRDQILKHLNILLKNTVD